MAEAVEVWKTVQWKLPQECRDNFWEQMYRCGVLWGCPIPKEPTNEFCPNLITILERLTHILSDERREVLVIFKVIGRKPGRRKNLLIRPMMELSKQDGHQAAESPTRGGKD